MSNLKRSFLVVLSLLMIFSLTLTACKKETATPAPVEPTEKPVAEEPTEKPVVEEPTEAEPPEEEPEPVTFTTWDPSTDEGVNALFTGMNEIFMERYPWVTVETTHQGDYVVKLNTAFAAGTTPDMIWAWCNPSTFYEYVEAGLVMDLEDAYEEYGWAELFPASMIDAVRGSDGKRYGVPDFINGTVVAYNKDIFDQYGLTAPETWEEWMTVLDTLDENGVIPIGMGLSDGNWQAKRLFEIILVASAGREWTEALYAGDYAWTEETVIDALEKLEMMAPYISEGSLGMNSRQGWDLWYQQDAAMMISDTWQFTLHDRDATFNWDWFDFPSINPDVDATFVGAVSDVLYIPIYSEHPDIAVLYMDSFLSEESQALWVNYGLAFNAGDYYGLITEEALGAATVKLANYINENGFTTWFDVGNPSDIAAELAPTEFAALLNGMSTVQDAANNIEEVAAELYGR
jgi:raffinose/stachyose/melibiose transport system substrate-binding protein